MAVLRRRGAKESVPFVLTAEVKIGRDADNDLVIDRASVSGRHATLRWTSSGWILKDSSKYGTLVNGVLVKGVGRRLELGDELTFVESDEVWTLVDAEAPGLVLRPVDSPSIPDIHVGSASGLSGLPSNERPSETLLKIDDAWFIESSAGGRRALVDGETVEILGQRYLVSAPKPITETMEPENPATQWSLDTAELAIVVLRGEDEAGLTIHSGGSEKSVKPSSPLYLLAYLAEKRLEEGKPGAPSTEDGWLHIDRCCDDLNIDRQVLNVEVHRVREAIKSTGLANAANVIERRPSHIRIGVPSERLRVARG
jgi:pSer/pThr/pTyr-binding forkhead associated (FHA) protein